MHILIDECLPKKLKQALQGHTVFTVQEKGWSGIGKWGFAPYSRKRI